MAQGHVDPSKTMAELALERMQATGVLHMPPAPLEAATADEIATYSDWLSSGALAGDCGAPSDAGMDPYDTPVVCTSATYWTGGNRESPLMRPGGACVSCHQAEHEGPLFAIAGTLFPSPHEPDDCNGVNGGGAEVIITDANGVEHRLTPNAAGNFFLEGALATPYSARVSYGGKERAMLKTQTKGDCNSCHTEAGTEDAPGRIFVP
jgi:hypothetical protein